MKLLNLNIIFIATIISTIITPVSLRSSDPLLVVILMVKNEATVMQATLQPFLDAGLQHYLILDTGSTDGTIEVTRQAFEQYNVQHGYIVEKPFVDFATSRNDAINFAEELFPHAKFFFMIDAEWYVQNVPGLVDFCEFLEEAQKRGLSCSDAFLINVSLPARDNYQARLFRAHKGLRFVGVVHEYLDRITTAQLPRDVYIKWNISREGADKSFARWHRDRDLLLKEHERNPNDLRTIFYLGQTFGCLGDHENAVIWYGKRAALQGWPEETFMAMYRLASSYEALDNWPMALFYYLKAYSYRSQRAEPLVRIAQHYFKTRDYAASFLFAKHSIDIPQSNQEILMVDKHLYDFVRHHLLAVAAWHLGEYEIGEQAADRAIAYYPDNQFIKDDFACYKRRKINM